MNSSTRNKVLMVVSQLIQENENVAFWDKKNFVEYFFNRLQSIITYNELWENIENDIRKLLALKGKNSNVAKANLHEVEYLRFEQSQKKRKVKTTDDESEDDSDDTSNISNDIMNTINEAIINCNFNDCEMMGRLFYRRCKQLMWNEKYHEALININYALQFWPTKKFLFYKVFFLHKLQMNTLQAFKLLKYLFGNSLEPNDQISSEYLRRIILEKLSNDVISLDEELMPVIFDDDDNDFVSNDNFKIDHRCLLQEDLIQGRYFVANDDIPSKQIVFRERPYSTVILEESLQLLCQNCFKYVPYTFYPCAACTQVVYCSVKCAKINELVHKYECGLHEFWLNKSKSTFHIFKLLNRLGLANIFKLDEEQTSESTEKYNINSYIYDSDQKEMIEYEMDEQTKFNAYRTFLDLSDHNEKFESSLLSHHLANAIDCSFVAAIVQGYDIEKMPVERMSRLVEINLKNIRRVLINSFQWSDYQWENNKQNEKKLQMASCLFLISSFLNHRCQNNTEWSFENGEIIFTTNRAISNGELISISYGCNLTSTFEERIKFNRSYFFLCNCEICIEDAKTVLALQCLNCPGPVLFPDDVGKNKIAGPAKCMICFQTYDGDIGELYDRFNVILKDINVIHKLYNCGIDKEKYSQLLIDHMDELLSLMYRQSKILVDALNQCCQTLIWLNCKNENDRINQLTKYINYVIIIDNILPSYDNLNNESDDNRELFGILKKVIENIEEEIDWMIFWFDLLCNHIKKNKNATIMNLIERFHLRLDALLNYRIRNAQNVARRKDKTTITGSSGQLLLKNIKDTEELKWLHLLKTFQQNKLKSVRYNYENTDGSMSNFKEMPNIIDLLNDF